MHHPISKKLTAFLAAASLFAASCSKNETPDSNQTADITYAIANVSGAYPNQTTYIQGLANLDMSSLDNSKAVESASFASQWAYGGSVFLTASGSPATMTKYSFDANGKTVQSGQLVVSGANTFSSVEFVSSTEAYASVGGGLAKLIKFNPSTFQKTGEIDLTPLVKTGAASTYYLGVKARDGKLFLGVQCFNSSFDQLIDSAFVAVIDIASSKVEKMISDARTSNIFLAGSSVSGFAMDSNKDLYIEALGDGIKPSGILRIKSGSTDFDKDYFFDLKAATGKDCASLYLFKNGLAFTTRIEDPTDAYETNGPNFRYYKIDLVNKKSLGDISSSLPDIYGSSTSIMREFDDTNIHFVVSSTSENSIYTYNISSGAITKKIALPSGMCTGLNQIK